MGAVHSDKEYCIREPVPQDSKQAHCPINTIAYSHGLVLVSRKTEQNVQKFWNLYYFGTFTPMWPPWRNWLARSAVNRKVGGSSPPGGVTDFTWGKASRSISGSSFMIFLWHWHQYVLSDCRYSNNWNLFLATYMAVCYRINWVVTVTRNHDSRQWHNGSGTTSQNLLGSNLKT